MTALEALREGIALSASIERCQREALGGTPAERRGRARRTRELSEAALAHAVRRVRNGGAS